MNWGWKLAIIYVAFAAGILTLVFKARAHKVDLVSADYYKQELAYGNRMEAMRNADQLSSDLGIEVLNGTVQFSYPPECTQGMENANMVFYCPSDASGDRTFAAMPDMNGIQQIPTSDLKSVLYLAKLSWTKDGKDFYFEKPVDLKK